MMPEGGLHNLPWVHVAGIKRSLKKVFYSNNLVLCIQEAYLKDFPFLVSEAVIEIVEELL